MNVKHIIGGFGLAIATLGAFAQPAPLATPRVDQREAQQQARIEQGVASGQLTRPEARRLEGQQARIRRTERQAKADGVVTAGERQHLTRMQNRASKHIHKQKHDAQTRG